MSPASDLTTRVARWHLSPDDQFSTHESAHLTVSSVLIACARILVATFSWKAMYVRLELKRSAQGPQSIMLILSGAEGCLVWW